MDAEECAEDAVKREIHEELGITVTTMQFLGSFPNEYVYKGISYFTCDLAFVCTVPDLSHLKPSDDVSEAILLHPNDIDYDALSFPSIRSIFACSWIGIRTCSERTRCSGCFRRTWRVGSYCRSNLCHSIKAGGYGSVWTWASGAIIRRLRCWSG